MAKYCTRCGSPIDEEAIFCVHCGNSVATAPKKAKNLGIGALVSVILGVVAVVGYYIFIFVAMGLAYSEAGIAVSALNFVRLLG
ncbi:MAG: zinc ribbon domain-containing protein [Clostridia bacterium]|nr:zinc ribbon domain-containing protein [Clostridia bacterium]